MDAAETLRVTSRLALPLDELEWRFSASGGPGGQHANTANTKVELRFDITQSRALAPYQRERLLERLGPQVVVVVSDSRSQTRNRAIAADRLVERLRAGLVPPTTRVPTKVPRSVARVRVETKRARSQTKADRRRPSGDD